VKIGELQYRAAFRRPRQRLDDVDPGMLDVVGFDTATPQLVSDFGRGAV
jgi:hypothetical protein